jgi:hypothetical protein
MDPSSNMTRFALLLLSCIVWERCTEVNLSVSDIHLYSGVYSGLFQCDALMGVGTSLRSSLILLRNNPTHTLLRDSGKLNCPRIAKRGYTVSKKALGGRKMELMEEVKELLIKTTKDLKGSARRLFMARTVRA